MQPEAQPNPVRREALAAPTAFVVRAVEEEHRAVVEERTIKKPTCFDTYCSDNPVISACKCLDFPHPTTVSSN